VYLYSVAVVVSGALSKIGHGETSFDKAGTLLVSKAKIVLDRKRGGYVTDFSSPLF